ncbi:LacI family transcriptional regulator [Capsulimonas corticalis]|uniref:LacI family transcriptional regulator n=1 Tax=Capsulimonas corticalis TaxID=2219043 RepID=A0A402D0D1_9BACT|nr:LacI family transcriptional regulator [Capsulimonas corticalis]
MKAGLNGGNQRFLCQACRRRYTPQPRERGYSDEHRESAGRMRREGKTLAQIAEDLNVSARTVANWLSSRDDASLPPDAQAEAPAAELEGLGKRRATIHDVAERAAVSTATISNYLNDKGRMGEGTRQRIETAIEALHFTPSALVRAIRQRRTHIIGIVSFGLGVEDTGENISLPILRGVNRAADRARYDVLLYTGEEGQPHRHNAAAFLNGNIDGLIWVAPALREPILGHLAAAGLPTMALLTRHVPDGVGYINTDNHAAMHALVSHLAALGHRRIAFVGPAHSSNFMDRRDGYRQSLRTHGIPWDKSLEASPTKDIWSHAYYEQMLDRWFANSPPTAIITQDDGFARIIIEFLRARHIRVPEDVVITGFNDVPDAIRIGGGLTTIQQPFLKIGEQGAERLIAMIGGAPVDDCRRTVETTLIVRATTAPPFFGLQ